MNDIDAEREEAAMRARRALAQAGISDATELLRRDELSNLLTIVKDFPGLTAWDLGRLLRIEARPETLEWLARRILVGELRECLGHDGWPAEDTPDAVFRYTRAFGSWQRLVGRDLEPRCDEVLSSLRKLAPPPGWRPESVNDPLLSKAFASWMDIA